MRPSRSFHNVLPGLPANKYTDADAAQRTVTVTTGLTKGQAPLDLPVVPELATKCLEMMNVPEKSLCNRLAFSDGVVHRPSSVPELLAFLSSAAAPRLFQGVFDGADLSSNIRNQDTWVDVSSIAELHSFWTAADGALHIGVQTSISTLMTRLGNAIAEADVVPSRSCNWVAMMAQLETFATPQARNGATVGNLLFTGDMLPVLSTIGATVVVSTSSSSQIVALSSLHRRADRPLGNAKGFATTLVLPACSQPEQDRTHYGAFKQGLGRALENLGLCSAGLAVSLTDAGIVSNADFVFGGVGWEPFRSTLSDSIVGKPWSLDTLKAELSTLMAEIPLDENSYGGRPEWRKTLFASFVFKFMAVSGASGVPDPSSVKLTLPRPITSAVQTFEVPDKGGITLTLDSQFCSGTGASLDCFDSSLAILFFSSATLIRTLVQTNKMFFALNHPEEFLWQYCSADHCLCFLQDQETLSKANLMPSARALVLFITIATDRMKALNSTRRSAAHRSGALSGI